jgi:hypothetical protein
MVGMIYRSHTRAPAPAGQPVRIEPDAWYADADLRLILRLPGATLQRARKTGELRHTRRGITAWHRGAWVIDWLSDNTVGEGTVDNGR